MIFENLKIIKYEKHYKIFTLKLKQTRIKTMRYPISIVFHIMANKKIFNKFV